MNIIIFEILYLKLYFFTQDINLNTKFYKAIFKFDDLNLKIVYSF